MIDSRFWNRVRLTANNNLCWLWNGTVNNKTGYGSLTIDSKNHLPHRYSYLTQVGNIPKGYVVMHKCDNKLCVNPNHLIAGTHYDNSRDMVNKGRQAKGLRSGRYTKPERTARGENGGRHKLTESEVLSIRAEHGLTLGEMAAKYNVDKSNIGYIRRRVTWKHI